MNETHTWIERAQGKGEADPEEGRQLYVQDLDKVLALFLSWLKAQGPAVLIALSQAGGDVLSKQHGRFCHWFMNLDGSETDDELGEALEAMRRKNMQSFIMAQGGKGGPPAGKFPPRQSPN